MDIIIGGAYQGKLDYAKEKFAIPAVDVFSCTEEGEIDFSRKCIYHLEKFTLGCVQKGVNSIEIFEKNRQLWEDSLLICADIFCGIVPMDAQMRAWREETGRLMAWLSAQAKTVTRMFCGLPQRIKE